MGGIHSYVIELPCVMIVNFFQIYRAALKFRVPNLNIAAFPAHIYII